MIVDGVNVFLVRRIIIIIMFPKLFHRIERIALVVAKVAQVFFRDKLVGRIIRWLLGKISLPIGKFSSLCFGCYFLKLRLVCFSVA